MIPAIYYSLILYIFCTVNSLNFLKAVPDLYAFKNKFENCIPSQREPMIITLDLFILQNDIFLFIYVPI